MIYCKCIKLKRFVNFKFLIVHFIYLSACFGELFLGEENFIKIGKPSYLSSIFTSRPSREVLMLKNFLPSFYEQVKQVYEIEL